MKFITVEQFQEQPKEIQKVLLDWWQPEVGDIFQFVTVAFNNDDSAIGVLGSEKQIKITQCGKGEYRTPLFTEGQLRKFIKDKLDMKIQCEIHPLTLDYIILVKNNSGNKVWMHTGKEDLLQAYWKVACMIAKEG